MRAGMGGLNAGAFFTKSGKQVLDPRVSIGIDEEIAPYAFVVVEGCITIRETEEERVFKRETGNC